MADLNQAARARGRQCSDCGAQLTLVQVPCPDGNPGCCVFHQELACVPCRQRRWEEHERPATIGELAALGAKVDRLTELIAKKLGVQP